jgi:hypothetical protein
MAQNQRPNHTFDLSGLGKITYHLSDFAHATRLINDMALVNTMPDRITNILAALPSHSLHGTTNDGGSSNAPDLTVIKGPSPISILPALPVMRDTAI